MLFFQNHIYQCEIFGSLYYQLRVGSPITASNPFIRINILPLLRRRGYENIDINLISKRRAFFRLTVCSSATLS